MRSFGIKRTRVFQVLALVSLALALALPLASQAATRNTSPGPPSVSTGSVTHVVGSSGVLGGSINPRTFATTYYFQYGPTVAYGSQTTPASLPAGTTPIKVGQAVTGLRQGYHYRLVATNADGPTDGRDRIFSATNKKKSQFELPKSFEPTVLGSAFFLGGRLAGDGNGNREIVLQATPYPYAAPYADVGAPILTSATGGFSFRVPSLSSTTRFRVVTVGGPPVLSKVVTEHVTVRVILKVRTSSHHKGIVRLYGTVAPAEVGARVFFQIEKTAKSEKPGKPEKPEKPEKPGKSEKAEKAPAFSSTKFNTVVKRGTKSFSRFSTVVTIHTAGRYRAFVEVHAGALASGTSQSILLHAAPNPTKKSKKKK